MTDQPPIYTAPPLITPAMYWMGRDRVYANQLSPNMRTSADETLHRVNALIALMHVDGVELHKRDDDTSYVTSGWRPPQINKRTPGAAVHSLHMTCEAIDLYDPHSEIDDWCLHHLPELELAGLWLEHPSATKGWCHLQTRGPKSGRRVFYP
jgi:hypothetical protein